MKILFAFPKDIDLVVDTLKRCDLVHTDLRPDMLTHFILLYQETRLVGLAGLENPAAAAWLRSLAVVDRYRGSGYGTLLVDRIERYARDLEVGRLFLLTQTAEHFFSRLGYQRTSRKRVPHFLQGSEQFRHLCPQTAVCMTKPLYSNERR